MSNTEFYKSNECLLIISTPGFFNVINIIETCSLSSKKGRFSFFFVVIKKHFILYDNKNNVKYYQGYFHSSLLAVFSFFPFFFFTDGNIALTCKSEHPQFLFTYSHHIIYSFKLSLLSSFFYVVRNLALFSVLCLRVFLCILENKHLSRKKKQGRKKNIDPILLY